VKVDMRRRKEKGANGDADGAGKKVGEFPANKVRATELSNRAKKTRVNSVGALSG